MARKAICIYDDKYLGVDEIYTLCEGMPVYIEGKVERLRELGHQKKLFCHCGCGANVILVAGKEMKRAPHFRVWGGSNVGECTALNESDNSIWSKLILKLWMQDKLQSEGIAHKVSLNQITSSERKFEFTFYDYENKVGLCYWNKCDNITTDKVNTVESCNEIKRVFYIVDITNSGTDGQYQEFMNKIQSVQGYNLFLNLNTKNIKNMHCENVILDVRIFVKTYIGLWKEINVISDFLSNYSFSTEMDLLYKGSLVRDYVTSAIDAFREKDALQKEKEHIRQEELRLEKERQKAEKLEKERLAREKAEQERLEREAEKERTARERVKARENRLRGIENDIAYKKAFTEEGEKIADLDFATYGKPIVNQLGWRYKQCKVCGCISKDSFFVEEKEGHESNFGICSNCKQGANITSLKKSDKSIKCPRCGGQLEVVPTGLGERLRCRNFPTCKYMETL